MVKRFGAVTALRSVSFDVAEGEIRGLMGPNGSGKTTLFNCVSGFLAPDTGEIRYRGRRISGMKPYSIARRGIVRTFQQTTSFPSLSIEEALQIAGRSHPSDLQSRERTAGLVSDCLRLVGLDRPQDVHSHELSFGQSRIFALALALATGPQLLLLDEPAAGLEGDEASGMATMLRKFNKAGIAILIVDHDMAFLLNLVDRVVVFESGAIIADGEPQVVRKNPEVIRAYLGSH